MTNEKVVAYYTAAHGQYLGVWGTARHRSMHFGFYDSGHRTHNQAVINSNRFLSSRAKITSTDRVLDAGCGVGGSSLWLGKNIGCRVTGVSITPRQIADAKKSAAKEKLEGLVDFMVADYLHLPFPDKSFTVVWAVESVCHAEDKADFLREAFRILKPGGRLIVADGFSTKTSYAGQEQKNMRGWLDAWIVPNLSTVSEFEFALTETGFTIRRYQNVTEHVMPSSKYMFTLYRWLSPWGFILGRLGFWSKSQVTNMVGTYHQHIALNKGLWEYGIYYAEK